MDITPLSTFAVNRSPHLVQPPRSIEVAWDRSQHTLRELSRRLSSARLHPGITTVYASGSLGRMEQLSNSDADVVVIVDDSIDACSPDALAARDSVWQLLVEIGLPQPKATGVFSSVDTAARLCDPSSRGVIDEDMGVFGRRFQMLLDSQPVFGPSSFRELQSAVLDRYASDRVVQNSGRQWTYLLSDLIRYWQSLRVRTQWIESPGEWRVINTKLRHSRLLNYAGLLLLIGECCEQPDEVDWLKQHMPWTPLERVAAVFAAHNDPGLEDIAKAHGQFLEAMNDESIQSALGDSATKQPETDEYLMLKSNSEAIYRNLLRFVMGRNGEWPERFFECLIF